MRKDPYIIIEGLAAIAGASALIFMLVMFVKILNAI